MLKEGHLLNSGQAVLQSHAGLQARNVCRILGYTSGCWGVGARFRSTLLRAGWGTHTSAATLTAGAGTVEETHKVTHEVNNKIVMLHSFVYHYQCFCFEESFYE